MNCLRNAGANDLVERIVEFGRIPARGQDPQRLVAHVAQHGFVERGHAADHGHLVLQAVFDELAQEAESVRAGGAEEDGIRALHLRDIAAVIRRRQRREDLLDDLAAIVLEHALEAGAHFVAVGEVVGDGDDLLVFQFLGGIVGERVGALRRGRGQADEPRARMPLRHVLGRGDAERRHFLFGEIVGDRERLEGGERADDAMDVVLFDQLLRLGARGGGNAGGVGDDQLDLAAGERVVALLQEHRQRQLHVDAAGGQRAGLGRQHADADRAAVLRKGRDWAPPCWRYLRRQRCRQIVVAISSWILPGNCN